eukprot:scaffold304329_cov18-Tisochrysis_lutea.AAC.2
MGEPLNNYEAVRAAIASMVDPTQWGLSPQRVTVSTVGVVNRVKQLGQDLPVRKCRVQSNPSEGRMFQCVVVSTTGVGPN